MPSPPTGHSPNTVADGGECSAPRIACQRAVGGGRGPDERARPMGSVTRAWVQPLECPVVYTRAPIVRDAERRLSIPLPVTELPIRGHEGTATSTGAAALGWTCRICDWPTNSRTCTPLPICSSRLGGLND